MIPLMKSSSN